MNITLTQFAAALVMVGVGIALVLAYRRYLAANSERRMRAMLEAVGLDPEVASIGGIETIMSEVRHRCSACNSESVCEQWLVGDREGGNEFCPNARVFEIFKRYRGPAT
jgi:hypothetical protein